MRKKLTQKELSKKIKIQKINAQKQMCKFVFFNQKFAFPPKFGFLTKISGFLTKIWIFDKKFDF